MAGIVKYQPKRSWSPLANLLDFHRDMDEIFDTFFTPMRGEEYKDVGWYPAVDIYENEEKFTIKAELPGMKENDIHIAVEEDTLTIEGERKEEMETREGHFHKLERTTGSFCRSFQLPSNLKEGKIRAHYKDGILEVDLPKTVKSKPKHIDIKVA